MCIKIELNQIIWIAQDFGKNIKNSFSPPPSPLPLLMQEIAEIMFYAPIISYRNDKNSFSANSDEQSWISYLHTPFNTSQFDANNVRVLMTDVKHYKYVPLLVNLSKCKTCDKWWEHLHFVNISLQKFYCMAYLRKSFSRWSLLKMPRKGIISNRSGICYSMVLVRIFSNLSAQERTTLTTLVLYEYSVGVNRWAQEFKPLRSDQLIL